MAKNRTPSVLGMATLALLAWEAYTLMDRQPEDTISETFWRMTKRPLVPFLVGALTSHFLWQSQDVYQKYWAEKEG